MDGGRSRIVIANKWVEPLTKRDKERLKKIFKRLQK